MDLGSLVVSDDDFEDHHNDDSDECFRNGSKVLGDYGLEDNNDNCFQNGSNMLWMLKMM